LVTVVAAFCPLEDETVAADVGLAVVCTSIVIGVVAIVTTFIVLVKVAISAVGNRMTQE